MKVILDIKENRAPFFVELLNSLDYVEVLKIVQDPGKSARVNDLMQAFEDVKLYEKGKKRLKTAKEFFDEL